MPENLIAEVSTRVWSSSLAEGEIESKTTTTGNKDNEKTDKEDRDTGTEKSGDEKKG